MFKVIDVLNVVKWDFCGMKWNCWLWKFGMVLVVLYGYDKENVLLLVLVKEVNVVIWYGN